MISREYTISYTNIDRLKIRQERQGHNITEFSVQYEALIDGHWRKITRFDNAHGFAHRHVYYPYRSKPEYKYAMNSNNFNEAFTEAQLILRTNFKKIKESYIILMNRRVG